MSFYAIASFVFVSAGHEVVTWYWKFEVRFRIGSFREQKIKYIRDTMSRYVCHDVCHIGTLYQNFNKQSTVNMVSYTERRTDLFRGSHHPTPQQVHTTAHLTTET